MCVHDVSLSVVHRNASPDGLEETGRRRETSGRGQGDGLHTHHCTDCGQFNTHTHTHAVSLINRLDSRDSDRMKTFVFVLSAGVN